jgi:inorganic pyrophosphatase
LPTLKLDEGCNDRGHRPQRSSAQHPTLYGFVPRTYCHERVRKLAPNAKRGDSDPLDICVLSERAIARSEIIVRARVIGGLQMIDAEEADDKIISVLENDYVWGSASDIGDLPAILVERLQHYFLTYKLVPGKPTQATITKVYGRNHALKVVRAAMADYADNDRVIASIFYSYRMNSKSGTDLLLRKAAALG